MDDRRGFANISDGELDEELSDFNVYLFNVFTEVIPVSSVVVLFLHDIDELFQNLTVGYKPWAIVLECSPIEFLVDRGVLD